MYKKYGKYLPEGPGIAFGIGLLGEKVISSNFWVITVVSSWIEEPKFIWIVHFRTLSKQWDKVQRSDECLRIFSKP